MVGLTADFLLMPRGNTLQLVEKQHPLKQNVASCYLIEVGGASQKHVKI